MKLIICDRCKKEVSEGEEIKFGCNTHDLCSKCYTELMDFMFKYKKEDKNGRNK